MASATPHAELHELLVHEPFVRSLARNLLDDDDEAEDVLQETWLAALALGRRPCASWRSWLGRVTWNGAVDRLRRRQRRADRERDAARVESVPSVSAELELEGVRAHVGAALRGLREPYRSALILRFYHDLSPSAVAVRQGVPVETVRTRTRRALALLRRRLAHEHDVEHGAELVRPALATRE